MASSVIKAKNRSTKLSQDEEVGMKCSTLVPLQPVLHLLCLVCRVVVDDEMQVEDPVHSGIDLLEEADEFLGAMASPAFADHLAGLHVEGGKQRGSAVALVVVRHRLSPPLLERQTRLRAVERLDLALLIDAQHQGTLRRVHVEADNVDDLLRELWVIRNLESAIPDQTRSQRHTRVQSMLSSVDAYPSIGA